MRRLAPKSWTISHVDYSFSLKERPKPPQGARKGLTRRELARWFRP